MSQVPAPQRLTVGKQAVAATAVASFFAFGGIFVLQEWGGLKQKIQHPPVEQMRPGELQDSTEIIEMWVKPPPPDHEARRAVRQLPPPPIE